MKAVIIVFILTCIFFPAFGFDFDRMTLNSHVQHYTLENGLKVIVKEEKSLPLVGIGVFYRVGGRNESAGKSEMAHLLEHMLFKETTHYKVGELNRTLNDAGAQFNGITSYDNTTYFEIVPRSGFETALALESERMQNALILPDSFALEKHVVASEVNMYHSNPWSKLYRAIFSSFYGEHPRGQVYGTIEDINNGDRDYVYNELYRKYYVPNNASLVIAGNVGNDEALALAKRYFGGIAPNKSLAVEKGVSFPQVEGGKSVIVKGEANGDFGVWMFNLPAYTPANRDSVVLRFIWEAGILYQFRYYETSIDGGIAHTSFTGEPDMPAETVDTDYITRNMEYFKERLFSNELTKYDSVSSILFALGNLERYGSTDDYISFYKACDTIQPAEVIAVIKKYFTRENSFGGYFKAVKKTDKAQSLASSSTTSTTENFGANIDYSDLENPTPRDLEKARAAGVNIYKETTSSLKEYFATVKTVVLSNGLTLIFKPFTLNEKVSLAIGIRNTGALYQQKAKQAELTKYLVSGGGPQVLIRNDLAKKGAKFSSTSLPAYQSFTVDVMRENFKDALELIRLSLVDRQFMPMVFKEVKESTIFGLEFQKNDPSPGKQAESEVNRIFFGENGYGLDYQRDATYYKNLQLSDIEAFYKSYYRPENTVITVVGNLDFDEVLKNIKGSFESWTQQPAVYNTNQITWHEPKTDTIKRVPLNVQQDVIMGLAPTVDASDLKTFMGVYLADWIFGGEALSSRLSREMRGKQALTYSVATYLKPYSTKTVLGFYIQTDPKDLNKTLSIYNEELKHFRQNGPTEIELLKARNSLANRFIFSFESGRALADRLLYSQMQRGNYAADLEMISLLYGLEREELKEIIGKHYPDSYVTVIAGKY